MFAVIIGDAVPESTGPLVTVLRSRYVPGGTADGACTAELGVALTRIYRSDCHMQAAASPLGVRLTRDHIGKTPISIGALVLDVDCAEAHRSAAPAPTAWRDELVAKVERLAAMHPGPVLYGTNGGARIVYALAEPFEIATAAHAAEWSARYLLACAEVERIAGISCDRACADWQRLHRLPRVVRTPGAKPEDWGTAGDPRAIGAFALPEVSSHDPLGVPLAHPCGVPDVRIGDRGVALSAAGSGILYRLLAARGHVVSHDDKGSTIVCPNAQAHTTPNRTARLYAPSDAAALGWIECPHNGCRELSPHEWLAFFKRDELAAVGLRLGAIDRCAINVYGGGSVRLCVMVKPTDRGAALPYVRISAGTRAWSALWEAANVSDPSDLDPNGDLGAAVDELRGRELAIEIDNAGMVRRILPATQSEAA